MTDTMNTNGNDNDEISAEESEASKNVDLRALGIDPMSTPVGDLLKHYRSNVEEVKAFTKKQKEGTSDPDSVDSIVKTKVSKVVKCEDTTPEQTAQVRSLREAIASTVTKPVFESSGATDNLFSAAIVLDEVRNLLSMVEEEYQYHLNASIQAEKDKRGIKSTPSETAIGAKLTSVALSNLIKARLAMAEAMGENIGVDNLYKTDGQRKGFNADIFPRLPKLDVDGPVATNSTHLVFRFIMTDGTPVDCRQTTLNDVAHDVVSQGAYRITGKDLSRELKKAGKGIGATSEEWSLEFKTGTLYGKKA